MCIRDRSNGGAIHFGTLNPGSVLTNVLFRGNNCSEKGGSINFLSYNSGVPFYNVTFQSNTALMTGGAIHFEINNGIQFYAVSNNEIKIKLSKLVLSKLVELYIVLRIIYWSSKIQNLRTIKHHMEVQL